MYWVRGAVGPTRAPFGEREEPTLAPRSSASPRNDRVSRCLSASRRLLPWATHSAFATSASTTLVSGWAALLVIVGIGFGRESLGTVLTAAFVLQVTPSLWSAYRTRHPAGISRGTWLLILAELTCWGLYGIRSSDPRLITLGSLGVIASTLMLIRAGGTTPDRTDAVAALPSPG
jgi:hypothetical protein